MSDFDNPAPVAGAMETLQKWELQTWELTRPISDHAITFLPLGGVLIDIGANVGVFTEQVLEKWSGQTFLFEPVPLYANRCREKFHGNANVRVENFALSDVAGQFTLWLGAQNLGWNTFISPMTTKEMIPVDVETIVFDQYAELNGIQRIDVIKIDVEGAEYKVLNGMRKTLATIENKPIILCEVAWGPKLHPNWAEEVEAFEWLFENGYERIDYNVSATTDVIFRPIRKKGRRL